jgi:hypothetical protein
MPKGNPNPSPKTRIGAPNGPAPGKTSEQKRLELENAQRAMRIRDRFLRSLEAKLNDSDMDAVLGMLDAQSLKLIKDSEDRGLGQPVQPTDITNSDGSMQFLVNLVGKPDSGDKAG